jgi:hypothetical protein
MNQNLQEQAEKGIEELKAKNDDADEGFINRTSKPPHRKTRGVKFRNNSQRRKIHIFYKFVGVIE